MKNTIDVKSLFLLVPTIVVVTLLIIIGLGHLIDPSWVGEQATNSNYFQKSIGLITDAPHATSELFYSTLENLIVIAVGYSWGKKALAKQHQELDLEHGYEHD